MFSVHFSLEKFKHAAITGHFGFVFEEMRKSHDFRDVIVFPLHENAKPVFSNSSGLKSVLEKLRFRDGLAWTVGLTVEIKLRFQISPAHCGRGLNVSSTPTPNGNIEWIKDIIVI